MSAAFKVGLITILSVVTILVGVIYIWQINPYANYQLTGYFPHIGGIKVGSEVTLMGVKIGEVVGITPQPLQRRVKLDLDIDRQYRLPVGSSFSIVTTGLVGDKNVEVLPPVRETNTYLEPGSEITGTPPASLDAIFTEAQEMLKSARGLVEDEELRQDIKLTVHNVAMASNQMNDLFKDLKSVGRSVNRVTGQAELMMAQINGATAATLPDIRRVMGTVNRIAYNFEGASGRFNTMLQDPALFGDTKGTVRNLNELSREWVLLTKDLRGIPGQTDGLLGQTADILDNVEGITNDIREITGDPEVKSNVKTVAKNASQLTNALLTLTSPAKPSENPWKVDLRTEALGVARVGPELNVVPGAQVNFNVFGKLGFDFPLTYFRVGLDEIGDSNLVNLQAGREVADGKGVVRFGLVRGRVGAGADLNMHLLEQPLTLSGELYDINSPRMRLGVLQNIYEDYGLSFYWDSQFLKGINEFNLGLRWQPGNFSVPKESPSPVPAMP